MAPQTRKSQAAAHNVTDTPQTSTISVDIPEDLPQDDLVQILGTVSLTSPNAETIIAIYRFVLAQRDEIHVANQELQRAREEYERKEAEVEQVLQEHETANFDLTNEDKRKSAEIEQLTSHNVHLQQTCAELNAKLAAVSTNSNTTNQELQSLRKQIDDYSREKKVLADSLESAIARETRLRDELTTFKAESQTFRKQAYELQIQLAEIQSTQGNQLLKISNLEQSLSLHEQTVESLNNELASSLARYTEFRKQKSTEIMNLQNNLDAKTAEYDREAERLRSLKTLHQNVERKLNESMNRNRELQSEAAEATRAFQDEILAYKTVLEQHERYIEDTKVRVEEIEKEETTVRTALAQREEALLAQVNRERERADAAQNKVDELEAVVTRLHSGELPFMDASSRPGTPSPIPLMLSPTASIVSKLQKGGRSITDVYADFVRVQRELQQERQEKTRLENTLSDIFNEIQDRAPVLTQQRMEYERVATEASQLASQLSQALEERDTHARAARETAHVLTSKQKELTIVNTQLVDLSRQVQALTFQLARIEDPSLPEDMEVPAIPESGLLDSDTFVSSNLVLFRNLPHLQQQNQMLLKLTRDLGAKLEERDRRVAEDEETEVMVEARTAIESLQSELTSCQNKMEAYMRERDLFKSMAARQGGTATNGSAMIIDGGPDYHRLYDEAQEQVEKMRKDCNRDLDLLRNEIREARTESGQTHANLTRAKAEAEYLRERWSLLQDSHRAQSQELASLADRNRELQAVIRENENRISTASDHILEKSGRLDALNHELSMLRSEITIHKAKTERIEAENMQFKADRARNSQTLDDYRRMKDELAALWDDTKASLVREKERLASDLANLQDEVANDRKIAQARLNEKEAENRDMHHRLAQLNDEASKAREQVLVAQTTQTHLQVRADDLSKQLQLATEKLAIFERRPGNVGIPANMETSTEEHLRIEVATLNSELKSTQMELTQALANCNMYQELAQTTERALDELRKEHEAFTLQSETDRRARDNEMVLLREQAIQHQRELTKAIEEKDSARDELEAKQAEFAREKGLLEDIIADVQGVGQQAQQDQQVKQRELLDEAQRARDTQQRYQTLLEELAAALKDRETLHGQLEEVRTTAKRNIEDCKVAKEALAKYERSSQVQLEASKQEMDDVRQRYEEVLKQNDVLHKQLASVTAQAAQLTDLSDNSVTAAMQAPTNDNQAQELQFLVQHLKRDVDLVRGQNDLLKRENVRLNGDLKRVQSELHVTRQRLTEEREDAAKSAISQTDQQVLLAKIAENSTLAENNRNLREEKKTLEAKLIAKADELTAITAKLEPLLEQISTARNETEYMRVENKTLADQVEQWRKRATTIMSKHDRIDPEVHKQVQAELEEEKTKRQEAETFSTRWKNAAQKIDATAKNLRIQLDAAIAERAALQGQLVETQSEATKKIAPLQQKISELEQSLAALSSELERTRAIGKENKENATPQELKRLQEQVAILVKEKGTLQAEIQTLKARPAAGLPVGEAVGATTAPDGEAGRIAALEAEKASLEQKLEAQMKRASDMTNRLNVLFQDNRTLKAQKTNLEKELTALNEKLAVGDNTKDPTTSEDVKQRVDTAIAKATHDLEAATTKTKALETELAAVKQELESLKLVKTEETKETRGDVAIPNVEELIAAKISAIEAAHKEALATTAKNVQQEGEFKMKMKDRQIETLKQQLAAAKGATAAPATPIARPVPTPVSGATTQPTTSVAPALTPRGRGGPGRGGATRGRVAPVGAGRGGVLAAVNQATGIASPVSSTPPPAGISIMGAAGQKRIREPEDTGGGALAKRMKSEDPSATSAPPAAVGGLPPKPLVARIPPFAPSAGS